MHAMFLPTSTSQNHHNSISFFQQPTHFQFHVKLLTHETRPPYIPRNHFFSTPRNQLFLLPYLTIPRSFSRNQRLLTHGSRVNNPLCTIPREKLQPLPRSFSRNQQLLTRETTIPQQPHAPQQKYLHVKTSQQHFHPSREVGSTCWLKTCKEDELSGWTRGTRTFKKRVRIARLE